jgi:hypothetical protein
MAALTVTLSDIQAIRPVAANLNTTSGIARLSMYTDEARTLDLQPALGAELLNLIDTAPATYATLINGGTYVYNSVTYTFKGLKKALAYFVFSRLKRNNSSHVTAFGNVIKTDGNSEPESEKSIMRTANEAYDTGVAYLADCLDYVSRLYPDQTKSALTDQKKFDISAIGD